MKTKLIASLVMLGILTLAFIFKSIPESIGKAAFLSITAGNISSDFLIGAMDDGYDDDFNPPPVVGVSHQQQMNYSLALA